MKFRRRARGSGDPSEVVREISPGMAQAATSEPRLREVSFILRSTSTLFLFCCSCMRL